ncbi:hypothetical protein HMPREF9163_01191 [Selenomonas sp. oral taxon 138 str. F0429]|nr:hypothetical protein HMPREF9163_01191 [Selenomonas sp. oral taxon 138 str. F0429]
MRKAAPLHGDGFFYGKCVCIFCTTGYNTDETSLGGRNSRGGVFPPKGGERICLRLERFFF